MQEEIFGPILPVARRRLVRPRPSPSSTPGEKPLALYVFAGDDAVVDGVLGDHVERRRVRQPRP